MAVLYKFDKCRDEDKPGVASIHVFIFSSHQTIWMKNGVNDAASYADSKIDHVDIITQNCLSIVCKILAEV